MDHLFIPIPVILLLFEEVVSECCSFCLSVLYAVRVVALVLVKVCLLSLIMEVFWTSFTVNHWTASTLLVYCS